MGHNTVLLLAAILLLPASLTAEEKKTREQKVREDQQKVVSEGFWIYHDLPMAFQKARELKKPILVILRCIPCEECVKLDDDLVDADPVLRTLLKNLSVFELSPPTDLICHCFSLTPISRSRRFVPYDGHTDLLTDSDVLRYGIMARQPGDVVPVEILRGAERRTLKLPMQE